MAPLESFLLIQHISSYLASIHLDEEVLFMIFLIGVHDHPKFKLLHIFSELYKGCTSTLSIDFLIHNIEPLIEAGILTRSYYKAYLSQYSTPLDHHIFQERQYVYFLTNIELVSLCFYGSFFHRSMMTIVLPLTVMFIQ
jgi:hypothetical protein